MEQGGMGLLRRWWSRLIDGEHPWGSLDVHPDRFGVTRYRLVVYPPGIGEAERRRVRVSRGWPLWGAVVWMVCEIWLSHVTGPWLAFGISSALFVGSGAAAAALAGSARTRVRSMTALTMAGRYDPTSAATRDKLEALATALVDADDRLDAGQIAVVDHELVWWRVYRQVASGRTASAAA